MWQPFSQGPRGSSLIFLHQVASGHLCPPWGCPERAHPCGRAEREGGGGCRGNLGS